MLRKDQLPRQSEVLHHRHNALLRYRLQDVLRKHVVPYGSNLQRWQVFSFEGKLAIVVDDRSFA